MKMDGVYREVYHQWATYFRFRANIDDLSICPVLFNDKRPNLKINFVL